MGGTTRCPLEGGSVLVVGGAGLIGSEISLAVGQAGGTPIVVDTDLGRLRQTIKMLEGYGLHPVSRHMSVASRQSICALRDFVLTLGVNLTGVVVAAYPRLATSIEKDEQDLFREELAHHVGTFYDVNEVFAEYLGQDSGGAIVNLSSIYGSNAPRFDLYTGTSMTVPPHYAASKAAIDGLTRYFAARHLKEGVRFNAIACGGVRNDQPHEFMNRYDAMCGAVGMLAPGDISGLAVYLLSDFGSAITGQVITVDDGWSL